MASGERAFIDRSTLHRTRPMFKFLLALVGWSNTFGAAMIGGMWIEARLMGSGGWIGASAGFFVALCFTLGQVYTSDAAPGWYLFCLTPETLWTAIQHQRWAVPTFEVFFGDVVGLMLAWSLALGIGYYAAKLPERMIFGPAYQ